VFYFHYNAIQLLIDLLILALILRRPEDPMCAKFSKGMSIKGLYVKLVILRAQADMREVVGTMKHNVRGTL
jgi:hypothetical protein